MPTILTCPLRDGRVALRNDDAFQEIGPQCLMRAREEINAYAHELNRSIAWKWTVFGLYGVCSAVVFQCCLWWESSLWEPCGCLMLGSIVSLGAVVLVSVVVQLWYWYQLSRGGGPANERQIVAMYLLSPTRPTRPRCLRLLRLTLDALEPYPGLCENEGEIVRLTTELWIAEVSNSAIGYSLDAVMGYERDGLHFMMVTGPNTIE